MRVNERTAETTTKKQELTAEVTGRKKAEAAVREADQKYRTLFDSSPHGIAITTLDGEIVDVDQDYQDMVGYTLKELRGTNFRELTPKKWHKLEAQAMKDFMFEGYGTFEKEYIRKDGTIFPVSLSAWLIRDGQGNPAGIGAFLEDITARKRAEEALWETDARYKALFDRMLYCVYVHDFEGRFLDANDAALKLLGYTREELPSLNISSLLGEDQLPTALKALEEIQQAGRQKGTTEYKLRTKDGDYVWVETEGSLIYRDGKPYAIQGIARDITEREETEEALRRSEENLRALIQNSSDVIQVVDSQGIIRYVSPSVQQILGYQPEELVGRPSIDVVHPDDLQEVARGFEEAFQKPNVPVIVECRCKHKDGTWRVIEGTGVNRLDNPALNGVVSNMRDITERKWAEKALKESEERYRTQFEGALDAIFIADTETGILVDCNWEACKLVGRKKSELVGQHQRILHPRQKTNGDVTRTFKQHLGEKEGQVVETQVITKKGGTKDVAIKANVIELRGKKLLQGIFRDITERKQAEEALQEAKTRFEALFETANELIITTDAEGWVLRLNKEVEKHTGYSRKELIGKSILEIAYPEDRDKFIQFWQDILSGLNPHYELRTISKTGVVSNLLASGSAIRKDGNVVEIQYNAKDITEEKQAEETLRRSEQKYRSILENIIDGYYELDLAGNLTFFNDSLCRTLGYTRDELLGMNNRQYMDEENAAKAYQIFNEVYRTGKPYTRADWEVIRKDGTKLSISSSVSLIRDSQGKPIGFRGLSRDITQQQRAAEELRRSEEKYRTILESVIEGYYEVDLAGNFTFVNDSICHNMGYSKDELIGMNNRDYMDEQTAKKVLERYAGVYTTGQPARGFDFEIIRKDGTKLFISVSISLIRDSKGEPTGFRGVVRDTTEEKQAEEELRKSEERYRSLFETATDGIFTMDLKTRFTSGNKKAEEMCGYSRDELLGEYATLILPEEEVPRMADVFKKVLRGETDTYETRIITKNGDLLPVEVTSSPVEIDGKIIGTMGMVRDITERKQAEEALRRSEEKYRTILETMTEGYYQVDLAGNFTFFNDAMCRTLGYTRDELLGMNNRQYMDKSNATKVYKVFNKVYRTGKPIAGIYWETTRKDGTKRFLEASVSLMRTAEGKPTGFRGIVRDSTERKQMEQELHTSEEQYRNLFESAPDAIIVIGFDGTILDVNSASETITGLPREKAIGKHFTEFELFDEKGFAKYSELLSQFASGGSIEPFEVKLTAKGGKTRWIIATGSLLKKDNKPYAAQVISRDITARKQAQEKLQQERDRLFSIFDSISQYVIIENQDYTIEFMNQRAIADFGNLIGRTCYKELGRTSPCSACPINRVIKKKKSADYEIEAFGRVLLGTGTPLTNPNGSTSILEVLGDITERKRAEEELRESKERYRQLTEEINDAIYTVDQDGNVTYVSPVIEWLIGYSPSEIMGRSFAEFMHEEDLPHAIEGFERTLSGHSTEDEYRFHIKSGEIRWMGTSNRPIFAGDRVVGARGTLTDITERKLAEEASEEARTRFEDLFESANELIITTDPEGWVLHVNKEVEKLSGLSKKELVGQSILNIAYPEDVPKYIQFWKDILDGLSPHYELRAISAKKPGQLSHLLASGSTVTKDGKIVEIQYNAKDISEEKQAEEKLRESEKKYRNILENMTDGYFEVDIAGNLTFFNNSMCEIIGYPRDKMMGMNNRKYMDKENARKVYQTFNKIYVTGKPARGLDWEITRKDGTKGFVEASTSLVRNAQGEPTGFRGVVRDITERKQMEKEKDELQQRAQLASRLSVVGEMASGIVHEINNPLTSVIGFAEMLAHSKLPEDAREYATIINNEGKRVASIAGRLLNFARHQKPETVYTDINKLIEATLDLQTYEMTTGNIKVTANLDPHLPQTMADPGQLQQVFLNIMLNARTAMRTAHGGGKLSVKTEALDDTIRISLKDDGPGILHKNLKRIFNPFFTTSKAGEGTGLGLSICQGIISSHKGKIYAESRLRKGATFIIELPVVARQKNKARTASANGNNVWQ